MKWRESVAAIITYGDGTASGKTSVIVHSMSPNASSPSYGETGLGSPDSTTRISTRLSRTVLRTCSTTPATVSPTMTRMLSPALAVEAITLSAGEPDRVVAATVVRVIAAASGPAATSARVSTGLRRSALAISGLSAAGACGARRRISSIVGAGVWAGKGERSSRMIARAIRAVGPHPRRRRRVPAAPLDHELERGDALLGHADHADRDGDAGERVVRDRAALVDDEPGPHAAVPQLGHRELRRLAGHLLVAAEREPDVLAGGEPCLEVPLDRLADRDQAALVVERAATPDVAVHDLRGERRVLPRCVRVDGDDVEVGHQDDRPLGRRTGPAEEQAVGRDPGELQLRVDAGELGRELGQEGVERRGVLLGRVAVRHGRDPHQRLELGDGGVRLGDGHDGTLPPSAPNLCGPPDRSGRPSRRKGPVRPDGW